MSRKDELQEQLNNALRDQKESFILVFKVNSFKFVLLPLPLLN